MGKETYSFHSTSFSTSALVRPEVGPRAAAAAGMAS